MAGVGAAGLLLTSWGPCGPSSALGLLLVVIGSLAALLGWCVSTVSVARGMAKGTLRTEGGAFLIGAVAAVALSTVLSFSEPAGEHAATALLVFVWTCPPLVAGAIVVAQALRNRQAA